MCMCMQVLFGSEASACKAALNMPRGGKEDDIDLDASKTGEAFDPRTLDLKARDRARVHLLHGDVDGYADADVHT